MDILIDEIFGDDYSSSTIVISVILKRILNEKREFKEAKPLFMKFYFEDERVDIKRKFDKIF